MKTKTYKDFDLSIERSGDRYRARVLNSPDGPGNCEFDMPFSDIELENFVLKFGQTRRTMRNIGVAGETVNRSLRDFGGGLYSAIFSGQVADRLHGSLGIIGQQENAGLRIRLRLSDAPELIDVPWEYLFDASAGRFLSLSVDTPVVRYLDIPGQVKPLAVKPPLRILVMLSSPASYAELNVEQEWQKLKDAVADLERRGLVVLERMDKPTLAELQRRLRKQDIHIFHFIGHGGFDEANQDGVLILETEDGKARPTSGKNLGTILHDEKSVQLAVLNACEGGRTSRQDPFAGAGQSLVQAGIPAVMAMQFEISDQAAITLAHEFYAALADNYPVDAALAEARKAIFAQDNLVEWGTPVLYMRSGDGRIFDLAGTSPAPNASHAPSAPAATQLPPSVQQPTSPGAAYEPRSIGSLHVVPVDALAGRIVVARPRLKTEEAAKAIMAWAKEWKVEWPAEVTEATITEKLELVYVPFVVTNGSVSATVTASVGRTKIFSELTPTDRADKCFFCEGTGLSSTGGKCIHCDGRGYKGESIYAWTQHTRPTNVTISDSVTANYGSAKVELDIRGRSTKGVEMRSPFPSMSIIEPEVTSEEAFRALAQRQLRDRLQAEFKAVQEDKIADAVRNFSMADMSIQQIDTYSWLLPVYMGVFGSVTIQVDAETGVVVSYRPGDQNLQPAVGTSVDAMMEQVQVKKEKTEARVGNFCGIIVLLGLLAFGGFFIYLVASNW